MNERVVQADEKNWIHVLKFIKPRLINLPRALQMKITLSIEELFTNIIKYAYLSEPGDITIRMEVGNCVTVEIVDNGRPYNPLERDDPDITADLEERQPGGLGIFMVKKFMDEFEYRNENNKNIVVIKKRL